RVSGILVDGLLQEDTSLARLLVARLVEEVDGPQGELVRRGIVGGALGETRLLLARQLQAQVAGDLAGELLLQREDVGQLAVVLLAPDDVAVVDVDELDVERDRVASLE